MLNGDDGCIFCLVLLLIRFLLDLKVLTNVKLCRDGEIDLNHHDWIKV